MREKFPFTTWNPCQHTHTHTFMQNQSHRYKHCMCPPTRVHTSADTLRVLPVPCFHHHKHVFQQYNHKFRWITLLRFFSLVPPALQLSLLLWLSFSGNPTAYSVQSNSWFELGNLFVQISMLQVWNLLLLFFSYLCLFLWALLVLPFLLLWYIYLDLLVIS